MTVGEFFKPLRRKLGVLTLLLACVLMVGWTRSLLIPDGVSWAQGNVAYQVISHAGSIRGQCQRWQLWGQPDSSPVPLMRRIRFFRPSKRDLAQHPMMIFSAENRRDYPGLSFGTYFTNDPATTANPNTPHVVWVKRCVVQYWLITIPLTLMSAWLLLSKPRPKRKPAA
jgi:hypothetical protein